MSGICCGVCHIELKDDDLLIMDVFYTLKHQSCYDLHPGLILENDTFKALKIKYPFYVERPLEETIRDWEGDGDEDEDMWVHPELT